ncbi:hypothetical protein [Streptomyces sp. NPDC050264]|uniref:hypothetical protein n=1 Tax=Streptomyces sp. NPDC050264 TaxID=3155038 RepID=UPI00342D10F8
MLFGLTAAVTLAACGVPPSGVIEAGEPASGLFSPTSEPSAPATVSLFFLRDGDLTAYPRRIGDAGDVEAVVRLLFEGPTASEAATATTELPRLTGAPQVATGGAGALSVQLPGVAAPLNRQAMLQLACTVEQVALALAVAVPRTTGETDGEAMPTSSAHPGIHVLGDGWTMTQSDYACPVASPSQEQPEHY